MNKYKNDIVLFAEQVLKIPLYSYQKKFLRIMFDAHKSGRNYVEMYPRRYGTIKFPIIMEEYIHRFDKN
ncbi:hypothetical protein D3C78_1882140 [compost metagenome]